MNINKLKAILVMLKYTRLDIVSDVYALDTEKHFTSVHIYNRSNCLRIYRSNRTLKTAERAFIKFDNNPIERTIAFLNTSTGVT